MAPASPFRRAALPPIACRRPPPRPVMAHKARASKGRPCSYPLNSGSAVCGSTCCNAIDGTCTASCALNRNAGRANCSGNPATGCDTDDTTTSDCGGCRGCSSANTTTVECTGGLCKSTCQAGWGNCSFPAAPELRTTAASRTSPSVRRARPAATPDACQANHSDGIGQTYSDCTAFGVPGNGATYTRNMAVECLDADPSNT